MRLPATLLSIAACLVASAGAAQSPPGAPPDARPPVSDGFDERLVLETARLHAPAPTEDRASFSIHGEVQLRFRALSDLRLQPPITDPGASTLGQSYYLYGWARYRPTFLYGDNLQIVGELDAPRGIIAGDTTRYTSAAVDPFDERRWYGIYPRKLYLQYLTPIGLFRVGHQTSHWGMGILANDGDHPRLFGDYRRGSIVERLLFATRPFGAEHPLQVAVGGDLVFDDRNAQLVEGDRAVQVIGAVRWQEPHFELGVYGVFRDQMRAQSSVDQLTPFTEGLRVGVVDVAGRFEAPLPGADTFVFGRFEGAFIGGNTTYVRDVDHTHRGTSEAIRAFGGAAALGAVHHREEGARRWGQLVASIEWGYASGDADPADGVTRRFSFDQNHKVGLVLFDHVMRWKTARSATIAQDPGIVNRAAPGLQFLSSEGAVQGATYLYPTIVVRPRHWLDLKAGVVIAQTTADFVDPFQFGALGNYANFEGGDESRHDLGVELDLGVDGRIELGEHAVVQVGAEGGVLFPGGAFDDAVGNRLPAQFLLNTRTGLQF